MRTPAAVVNKDFEEGEWAAVAGRMKTRVTKETKGVIGKTHRYLRGSSCRLHVHAVLQDCGLKGRIKA